MVADMAADMEVHMVANMEVDKVVKMVADEKEKGKKGAYKKEEEKRVPNLVRGAWKKEEERVPNLVRVLVIWAETFSTRSLPDLRVF